MLEEYLDYWVTINSNKKYNTLRPQKGMER